MFTAEELIAIRRALELGKENMARLLGVGVSSIHRWERGDTGPTGPVLQCYRALDAAMKKGHAPATILASAAGDPGVFLARVFSLAFLEDGHDAGTAVRSRSRTGTGSLRPSRTRS